MSIRIALVDAANNCVREGATATITLRSGVQVTGKLQRNEANMDSYVVRLPGGGWVVILIEEVAAVESTRC